MDRLLQDLRYAARTLVGRPGFTLVAVLSLALGIGANATIFSLVDALLLRPLPLADVDRLVAVFTTDERNPGRVPMSHLNWRDLGEQNRTLLGLAGYDWAPMSVRTSGEPEVVVGQMVSGDYFDLLGARAARGRTFGPSEDAGDGAHPVAVVSDHFWRESLGADPRAVGSTIRIDGSPFTVVGVAERSFQGPFVGVQPELWVPMAMNRVLRPDPAMNWYGERRGLAIFGIGKLRPGVTLEQAKADLTAIASRLEAEYPTENQGRNVDVVPVAEATLPGNARQGLATSSILLLGIVGIVLLIACANVANLLLARATARGKEIAIRLAQGASRGRLIRQLLTESLLLALVGGAAGLLVAAWAKSGLLGLLPRLPFPVTPAIDLRLDLRALAFTLGLSLATGLLFGLAPALTTARTELVGTLRGEAPAGRGGGMRRGRGLGRSALVVAQVALSLVALVAAGLFLRSLGAANRIDPGYDSDGLYAMAIDVGFAGMDPVRGDLAIRGLAERMRTLPGVRSASYAQAGPMQGSFARSIFLDGGQDGERNGTLVQVNGVGAGYFATIGIPVVEGREFALADRTEAPPVAIVNQTMAKSFWPGARAVGQRFRFFGDERPVEVVGIARDAKYNGLGEDPQPYLYLPHAQRATTGVTLLVRTAPGAPSPLPAMRREVQTHHPDVPITLADSARRLISTSLWLPEAGALLLAIFGLLALSLAALGIFGVTSFSVAQRRREIGIRMALGARAPDVLEMVLREAMTVVAIGLAIGLALAFAASRFAASLLYGIQTTDPVAFGGTSVLLAAVALIAGFLPARRAAAVDPQSVLKGE